MSRELAWNQLRLTLMNLAAPPDRQIGALPSFVIAADELVLEFDDWYKLIQGTGKDQVSDRELAALAEIDAWIDLMDYDPELYTKKALYTDSRWQTLRVLAVTALETFGWDPAGPVGAIDELYISTATLVLHCGGRRCKAVVRHHLTTLRLHADRRYGAT
ncbi:MAG TPA: hypothetical protein VFU06_17120 [Longimicrobiales bacterium]|nr:hypothetical protein [Longimicrobiales bacterium]